MLCTSTNERYSTAPLWPRYGPATALLWRLYGPATASTTNASTDALTISRDWPATHYMAFGGDSIVCAPEQGWPEDVALGLTDAPEAALACGYEEHSKIQLVMCSDEVHAVDWNDFRYRYGPPLCPLYGPSLWPRYGPPLWPLCGPSMAPLWLTAMNLRGAGSSRGSERWCSPRASGCGAARSAPACA